MVERIPAEFEVLDERFAGTGGDRYVDRLYADGRWLEGPAYHPAGRFVLFSDIPNDRVLRYDEISGRVETFLSPAGYTNGRTVDRQGRFVTCEHGGRRVTRIEHDGSTQRPGRCVRGAAAEQPERRGRARRRVDLVHRPDVRDPDRLRGPSGDLGDRQPTTSTGWTRARMN